MTLDRRAEVARGYMILGIMYVHSLLAFAQTRSDPAGAIAVFVQIKLLAPHVGVFFFLSGMGARHIGKRPAEAIAAQSLMLLILANLSQVIGYLIGPAISGPPLPLWLHLRMLAKPIVYGTGYCTFVAWFFVVLAAARPIVWVFERSKPWFLLLCGLLVALIVASRGLGLPDNLYEWRNWPAAALFFVIGMHIRREWQVPGWLGLGALATTLVLAWFNRPELLWDGPCLACDVMFVGRPLVGHYGSVPVFVIQEVAFLLFLLWGAQETLKRGFVRIPRYFGYWSTQLLLVHGWVMVATFTILMPRLPTGESVPLLAAFLVLGPLVYVAVFRLTRPAVEAVMAAAFTSSRGLVNLVVPQRRAPANA